MPNFRTALYERYVSTFKTAQQRLDDRAVEDLLAWSRHKYLPLLDDLDRDAPLLELGCGPGLMLELLRRHGFRHVEGIDISDEQVRLATERGLNARRADVFEFLGRTSERYEAILAIDFVEHFSKDELMRLIPLVHAALRPGGRLILQTPNGMGLFPNQVVYGDLTHLTIFTPESLRQLLQVHGFDEPRFYESGPAPGTLKGTLRLLLWRVIRLGAMAVRKIETGKTQTIWTENLICACHRHAGSAERAPR